MPTKDDLMRVGGRPVTEVLARDHAQLVDAVLAELVAQVPIYDRLPRELIQGDIRRVTDHALRLFPAALAGGPSADELASLVDSAALRADEGVPMAMVLAAYHRGARVAIQHCVSLAEPEELAAVGELAVAVIDYIGSLTAAVADGFSRHGRTALAEQAGARQLLVNALLAGAGHREAAGPAEVLLPERYLVLRFSVAPHPDEADPEVDRVVANRRKLRRMRAELERHYAAPVLWQPSVDGGLALVPDDDLARLRTVVRETQRCAGAAVHAAVVPAAPEEVAAAAPLAAEVLDVVAATGREPGLYGLPDVALDFQLRQASAAQPVLAALLAPLDGHPDLAATLDTFLARDLSRRRTAADLRVHPNTVDNRLRRVAALTGLDPTRAADLPTIRAALAAVRRSAPATGQ